MKNFFKASGDFRKMNYDRKRAALIRQICKFKEGKKFSRQVVAALEKVPRHRFVDPDMLASSYEDHAMPIDCNQTISQPYVVGIMTNWLALEPHHRVLEIGTGSGYQTAILAEIVQTVYSIEFHRPLADKARTLLVELGYTNVIIETGDGYHGLAREAPFDGIIVTCRVEEVPSPLEVQLSEGGRMVIPVGPKPQQVLFAYEKIKGRLKILDRDLVRFVPMLRD